MLHCITDFVEHNLAHAEEEEEAHPREQKKSCKIYKTM